MKIHTWSYAAHTVAATRCPCLALWQRSANRRFHQRNFCGVDESVSGVCVRTEITTRYRLAKLRLCEGDIGGVHNPIGVTLPISALIGIGHIDHRRLSAIIEPESILIEDVEDVRFYLVYNMFVHNML